MVLGAVIVGRRATSLTQSYRRKLLDGLVTSLALELSTLATLKLLNSLKVTLTLGLNQSKPRPEP